MSNPLDALLQSGAVSPEEAASASFRWATVTAVDPIRVRLDGDTVALPDPVPVLGGTPGVGDRVGVLLSGRRVVALAKAPPAPPAEWQTYSPTLFSNGTQPSMGNSTRLGRYRVDGKTVHAAIYLQIGSTFSPGTGAYGVTLPVPPHPTMWQPLTLAASLSSPAVGDYSGTAKIEGSNGVVRLHVNADTARMTALGGSGTVIVPVSGNRILISGTYEAA